MSSASWTARWTARDACVRWRDPRARRAPRVVPTRASPRGRCRASGGDLPSGGSGDDRVHGGGGRGGGDGGRDGGDGADHEDDDRVPPGAPPWTVLALAPASAQDTTSGVKIADEESSSSSSESSSSSSTSTSTSSSSPSSSASSSASDADAAHVRGRHRPTVSVIIPALNEATALPALLRRVSTLDPPPLDVVVSVGDSDDATADIARAAGAVVVRGDRGRARQMNAGAAAARGDVLLFLHADTYPPADACDVVADAMTSDDRVVLGGFVSIIETRRRTFWGLSAHNVVKSFYCPAIFRPRSFAKGLRVLFGDQAMFCRAGDFAYVGGFDEALPIMEDADLCVRMHVAGPSADASGDEVLVNQSRKNDANEATGTSTGTGTSSRPDRASDSEPFASSTSETSFEDSVRRARDEGYARGYDAAAANAAARRSAPRPTCEDFGKWRLEARKVGESPSYRREDVRPEGRRRGRVVLVNRLVTTSGRRVEELGNAKATAVHFLIGLGWYFGADPDAMVRLYKRFYSDVR